MILAMITQTAVNQVDHILIGLLPTTGLTLPFVKLFGFSHTLLRACTVGVSVLLVWLIDRIVHVSGAPTMTRALVGVLLIGNPIFLHVAFRT